MASRVIEEEGSLVLPDGTTLYTKSWKPAGESRAIVAFCHGFNDHCNAFFDFFPNLASSGIEIRSFDQRGWGRSVVSEPKLRGDFGSTSTVMNDLHFYLQSLVPYTKEGSIPLFLAGHSMGGQNTLYYTLNPESPYHNEKSPTPRSQFRLAGSIAISPFVSLEPSSQPLRIVVYVAGMLQMVFPKKVIDHTPEYRDISRNQAVFEELGNEELHHRCGTLEGFAGMLSRSQWLNDLYRQAENDRNSLGGKVPPLWACHGNADRVTWHDGTKRLVESLNYVDDKTFKTYEGSYHKPMNEPDGIAEQMTKDLVEWVEAHISQGKA